MTNSLLSPDEQLRYLLSLIRHTEHYLTEHSTQPLICYSAIFNLRTYIDSIFNIGIDIIIDTVWIRVGIVDYLMNYRSTNFKICLINHPYDWRRLNILDWHEVLHITK